MVQEIHAQPYGTGNQRAVQSFEVHINLYKENKLWVAFTEIRIQSILNDFTRQIPIYDGHLDLGSIP